MADTETTSTAGLGEPEYEAGEHTTGHGHPSEREYVKIALVLALITAAEVAVYYIEDSLAGLVIPILTVMAVAKFVLVVMWFMHLRFDNKLFRRLFVAGIVLALGCFAIVLFSMDVFT